MNFIDKITSFLHLSVENIDEIEYDYKKILFIFN